MSKNFYEILGLEPNAEQSEIREKFRSIAMEVHPDINISQTALEKFVLLKEAYDTLTDPELRALHDESLGITPEYESFKDTSRRIMKEKLVEDPTSGPTDLSSLYEFKKKDEAPVGFFDKILKPIKSKFLGEEEEDVPTFLSYDREMRAERAAKKERPRMFQFQITATESLFGTTRRIVTPGTQKSIDVKIPRFISNGAVMRIKTPDLYELQAKVTITNDDMVRRSGSDITLLVPLSGRGKLGGSIEIDTLVSRVRVDVPAHPGEKVKIAGHGVYNKKTGSHGDFFAVFSISDSNEAEIHACTLLASLQQGFA